MNYLTRYTRKRISVPVAIAAFCVLTAWNAVARAQNQEIRVVTSGAFTAAYLELVPEYERTSHHKMVSEFGPSMGTTVNAIPMRLARGEAIDVIIMAAPALDDLIKQGKVLAGSRVDLVLSRIAVAVKSGSPKPDISSVAALKRTLLAAKSIGYSDSASGVYLSTDLFPKLGIADQIKSKSRKIQATPVGNLVASGEIEIGFQQFSELLPVKGIEIVGPLPAAAQQVTIFAAGIPTTSKHPDLARAFIQFLASPAAVSTIRKTGLEPMSKK